MTNQEKLYYKLQAEYNSFLDTFRDMEPGQIIEAAYEKVSKECILEQFEDKNFASNGQARYLLNQDNSLNALYGVWLDVDSHIGESIHTCMEDYMFVISDMSLDLPGEAIEGDIVQNYTVIQAVLFDNNVGFALAHNPNAVSPYVTWRMFNDSGKLDYEWGNYVDSEENAVADYISRYEDYIEDRNLTEIPIPPPTRLARVPQSNHTIITDITHTIKETTPEETDRIYKAELQLPDQQDLHLEVFHEENDVEAVKYAYELCAEQEGVFLMEVHELDENYDSIREIDLRTHDPDLRRFMGVDVIDFLGQIVEKTVEDYKSDFKIDTEVLWKVAIKENPPDQRLMWHCSKYGTHLLNEDEVFTKSTGAHGYWVSYRPSEPTMMGYVIEVTGYRDETVVGNIFEVGDYYTHAQYVSENALVLDSVSLTYSSDWGINAGKTITVPRHEYDNDRHRLMSESGNVTAIKYHPSESTRTMTNLLQMEKAKHMAMPIGNTNVHLQKVDTKLAEIRAVTEQPTQTEKTPTPAKPQTFDEILKEAQAKADKFNAEKAQNKGIEQPNKNNPQIGD